MSLVSILVTCTTLAALVSPTTAASAALTRPSAPAVARSGAVHASHPTGRDAPLAGTDGSTSSPPTGEPNRPPRPDTATPALPRRPPPTRSTPPALSGHWRWPLGPPAPRVVRLFSAPASPWGAGHRGVDLAAEPGQPVYAAAAGRVSYAGRLAGRGIVAVTHGALRTTYLPVRPAVDRGRQVGAGTLIGTVETTWQHCAVTCLHWGLIRGSLYLDPLRLVRPNVRLLPYWTPTPRPRSQPSAPPRSVASPGMDLRAYATTAGGGALAGMVLAFLLSLGWRYGRSRPSMRRPPPGVIDLARERRQRRAR
ncbi:M23 family metallopeptidase [Actinomadura rubrobrunea]|nr:M23 family metallopeptidase [Actinomadura rubrobrunea]